MRLQDYKDDLLKRLVNSEYAVQYLAQVLAEKDHEAFLLALNDVLTANGIVTT